jgi:hypothetical protein
MKRKVGKAKASNPAAKKPAQTKAKRIGSIPVGKPRMRGGQGVGGYPHKAKSGK